MLLIPSCMQTWSLFISCSWCFDGFVYRLVNVFHSCAFTSVSNRKASLCEKFSKCKEFTIIHPSFSSSPTSFHHVLVPLQLTFTTDPKSNAEIEMKKRGRRAESFWDIKCDISNKVFLPLLSCWRLTPPPPLPVARAALKVESDREGETWRIIFHF